MRSAAADVFLVCVLGLAQALPVTVSNDVTVTDGTTYPLPVKETLSCVPQADFNVRARQWVSQLERNTGHKVSWYDMYLKHPHLVERPQYHMRLTVSIGNIRWGEIKARSITPSFIFRRWHHNDSSEPVIVTMSESEEVTEEFTWTQKRGLNIGGSCQLDVGLPQCLCPSPSISATLDLSSTSSQTKTRRKTLNIEDKLVIPAHSSVRVEVFRTTEDLIIPYAADVIIQGTFCASCDDSDISFVRQLSGEPYPLALPCPLEYPIEDLACSEFPLNSAGKGLRGQYEGEFRGVTGNDHTLAVKEYPLQTQADQTMSHYGEQSGITKTATACRSSFK